MGNFRCSVDRYFIPLLPRDMAHNHVLRVLMKQYISIYDSVYVTACIPEIWDDAVNWGSVPLLAVISSHAC